MGRSVLASGGTGTAEPEHREEHRQANWLRDVILGGQDGLVNILGIVLGVIVGGGSRAVLLAAGFAAAITESISMGAVGYTSAVAERDYYQAERAREEAEIDAIPEAERQEIRDIYAAKGFTGELLDQVVATITANRETWLATMMDDELHLQPVQVSLPACRPLHIAVSRSDVRGLPGRRARPAPGGGPRRSPAAAASS